MTVAVVLSGGGANGAYEAGALRVLLAERGVQPDIICGTSVGAINGAFLAQFPKGEEVIAARQLTQLWFGIQTKDIYRKWYHGLLWYLPALWKTSVFNSEPVRKFLKKNLDPIRIKNSGKKLRVLAVSLSTGESASWSEDDFDVVNGVLASSSYPIFFKPITIGGAPWSDGGLRAITPLKSAVDLGADEIYVISCQPKVIRFERHVDLKIWSQAARTLDIMANEINREDLKVAQETNELCRRGSASEGKRELDIKLIQPTRELGDSLDFSIPKNIRLYNQGVNDAQNRIKSL